MDSLTFFVVSMLSLALIQSMVYNSRRLETIGYTLSVAFLQQLIAGNEDIFLICPQFPVYISPKDDEPSPDVTMPDPEAKGVYVDHALLLPRVYQTQGNLKLSQAFTQAHSQRNQNFWRSLCIESLEVPLLEEKKRAPTRHPHDLHDHVWSILNALDAAQSQVLTQAKILFSSPRFATQDLVILVASSGEYYRLAFLQRGHQGLSVLPSGYDVIGLLSIPREIPNAADPTEVSAAIVANLVVSPFTPAQQERQRVQALLTAEQEEKEKNDRARNARALARSQRKEELSTLDGHGRKLSQIVIDAGDPQPHSYSDEWIETYYKVFMQGVAGQNERTNRFRRYLTFFEPEPKPEETTTTFANLRNSSNLRAVVFTSVIRLGSPTSDKFFLMIHHYLSTLARLERSERQSNC